MIKKKIVRAGTKLPDYYIGDLAGMRQLKADHQVEASLVVGEEFYIDTPPADLTAVDQEGTLTTPYIWTGTHWSIYGTFEV